MDEHLGRNNNRLLASEAHNAVKTEINLPKIFTTKRGALMLFSGHNQSNDKSQRHIKKMLNKKPEEQPTTTLNDLSRNILFYGIEKRMVSFPVDHQNDFHKAKSAPIIADDTVLFSVVSRSTKSLMNNEIEAMDAKLTMSADSEQQQEIRPPPSRRVLKRIHRGLSARRYLRDLTKNWDQTLLDSFIRDRKLNQEEKQPTPSNDLSLSLPPLAYRFDQSWISAAVDMRSYKFVRAQDFDLNQNHNSQPQKSPIDEMDLDEKEEEKEAPEIKILDNNQSEVNYETLDKEEKEKVLTELLFNGALNKIKSEKNVVFYDENLNYSNEEVDENTKPLEKNSDFDLISGENSLKKDVIVESPKTTVGKSTLTIPEYHNEPNYMFGKHSASPLITNIKQTKQPNVIVPESQRVSQRDKSSRLKQNQNLVEVVDIKTLPISPQEPNLGEHEEIKIVPLNVDEVKPIVDEKTQDHKDDSSLVTEGNNLIQVEPTQLIQEEKHVEKVELTPLDENNNSDNLIIDNNEYHYVDNCIEEIRSVENEFALIDGEATNEVRNYRLERDKDLDDLIQEEENEHSKVDESAVLNNRDNKEQSQRLKLPRLSSVKKLYVVQKENKDPIENQQQNQLNKDYFKSEKSLMNESVWKNTLDVLKSDQNLYLPIKNNLLKRAKHNLIFLKSNDTVEKTQTSRLPHLNTDRSNYELRTTMQTHRSYDTTTSDRWFEKRLNESENVWRNFNTDLGRVETLKPEIKLHTSETAKGTSEIKPPISQKLAETKSAQAPKLTTRNFENDEMLDNWPKSLDMSGDKLKAKKNVEPESILKPNKLKTVIYESKRKVNWAAGDFDPREFFTQWSYESPPAPIVVDKMYAETLKRYAEYMAKFVLSEKFAGKSLSKDIKRALRTNLVKLKDKIEQGRVGQEILNEYRNIFKKVLTKTLKRRDLEDVRIDDNTLINLLEYPAHAFEIKRDEDDGVEFLRVKSGFLREQAKLIRNVVTERAISTSDFTVEYDPITGEKRFILKSEFAKQLGIPEQAKDMIELYYDENGEQKMRLKDGAKKLNIGDTAFELVQDPNTGAQVLKMVTKQKVGQESFEDILRLAKNMSPESRHRYFQELLKSSGDRMSEEMRRQIIEEMMKNAAENLDESMKEGVLKDLMVNLVNTLPSNLASKVLNDIMKSTDVMDSTIKEKMIKNLMDEFDDLPSNLKNATLKVIVNNLEDLPSQMKQDLLENILTQLENQPPEEDNKLRNQVLTEMLKNSQNFDAQTRNKILQNVFDRIAESTEGDEQKQLPSVVLEELVKQMYTLPEEMKARIVDEINRGLEHGELGPNVLGELLKNAQDLAPDLLENMIKNIDKMGSESIKELVKNLDKIPDELKSEMIENLLLNANNQTDENVKYELLEELLKNPELIQDEEKREQVLKEMVGHLTGDSILKHTENMSSEERAAFVQDLLKKAGGDLSEEARGKLVEMLVKDAKEAGGEGLTNLVNNLLKDLDPQSAGKLVNELMKNADGLDVDAKQRMIENLMGSLDNEGMSDQAKSYAYEELLKNLDGLNSSKKEEIMNQILNKVGDMSSDSCDQTIKALMDNLNDLSADQKNNLLQTLLNKMDDGSSGKNNAKSKADELKNEVIREILKNSKNLNEQQRGRILQEVLEKARLGGESDGQVSDVIMQELVSQMDSLPDTVKQTVLNEVKKDLARGRLGARTMKNLLKNAANVPKELLEQVVDNMKELPTETLQELTKNLDSLPTKLKDKAVRDLVTNLKDLDAKIKKQLLNEIATKPHLIKDKKLFETAIKDMVGSLKKLPEAEKKDMLKSLAKNINNLSQETKEKVMKEMFDNLENGDEDVRESILTQLVHKMGEADLETWIKCSDMADDLKEKMLQDIRKLMDEGNTLLDSDDEQQLVGLTGRQREIKKRQLIEKKKPATEEAPIEKPGLPKFTGVKKTFNWLDENREEIFELANSNQDEPIKLNQDQIEYFQAFSKLTKDEKAKIMETMTDEEKENFKDLQAEYERLRQLEIEAALAEARRLAIEKLRLKLEHEKKMAYLRMMRLEAKMFERSQQISRAFVYSYYDVIAWLNPNDSQALTKQLINSI